MMGSAGGSHSSMRKSGAGRGSQKAFSSSNMQPPYRAEGRSHSFGGNAHSPMSGGSRVHASHASSHHPASGSQSYSGPGPHQTHAGLHGLHKTTGSSPRGSPLNLKQGIGLSPSMSAAAKNAGLSHGSSSLQSGYPHSHTTMMSPPSRAHISKDHPELWDQIYRVMERTDMSMKVRMDSITGMLNEKHKRKELTAMQVKETVKFVQQRLKL